VVTITREKKMENLQTIDENTQSLQETKTSEEEDVFSERVASAELKDGTVREIEAELERCYVKYGHFFSSREDCDFFNMLPLSECDRMSILKRAVEIEKE